METSSPITVATWFESMVLPCDFGVLEQHIKNWPIALLVLWWSRPYTGWIWFISSEVSTLLFEYRDIIEYRDHFSFDNLDETLQYPLNRISQQLLIAFVNRIVILNVIYLKSGNNYVMNAFFVGRGGGCGWSRGVYHFFKSKSPVV